MNINLARTLANIARKAETLWADGYTAYRSGIWDDTYSVLSPEGNEYVVILPTDGGKSRCSCKAWRNYGECKHYIAVLHEHKKEEMIAAGLDAMTEEEYFGRW